MSKFDSMSSLELLSSFFAASQEERKVIVAVLLDQRECEAIGVSLAELRRMRASSRRERVLSFEERHYSPTEIHPDLRVG